MPTRYVAAVLCVFLLPVLLPAEITALQLSPVQVGSCGRVSTPNGVVLSNPPNDVTRISFDWGDGQQSDMYFPGDYFYSKDGTYTISVTAQTLGGDTQSASQQVTISNTTATGCATALRVTSPSFPPGTVQEAPVFQLAAQGGAAPYTFRSQGFVPGLTLGADGRVSGTPSLAGLYGFTIIVMDAQGNTAARAYGMYVRPPSLQLSQTGLTFVAQAGASQTQSQGLFVVDTNHLGLAFQSGATTVAGGNWLSVAPSQGQFSAPTLTLPLTATVNASGLAIGDYYGRVTITPQGHPEATQTALVVLNVQSAQTAVPPVVTPSGLLLVTPLGGSAAAAFSVANNSAQTLTATSSVVSFTGGPVVSVTPVTANIPAGQKASFAVQAAAGTSPAGIYRTKVNLSFSAPNAPQVVDVAVVVPGSSSAEAKGPASASGCTPSTLAVVATTLGGSFSFPVGWPVPIEASVADDCGTVLLEGNVVASFSNGDPPLTLLSDKNARFSVTWAPRNSATQGTQVQLDAASNDRSLRGSVKISGSVTDNPNIPQIVSGGVVSAASYRDNPRPSPDEIISVFGANLADGLTQAAALPLPSQLKSTTVFIAGQAMPLFFVAPQQINAVLPETLLPGAQYQMIVQNGNRLSLPEPVRILATEPGVFTLDASGKGQGHVYVVSNPGQQTLAGSASPAHTGDYILVYCTGLGLVNPSSVAGTATSSDVLHPAASSIGLQIGGKDATVAFAGLVPGFTGLYQINAIVPQGVTPGDAVSVIVTGAGIAGGTVTMGVR